MKALLIEAEQYTPKVILQPETEIYSVVGRSFPVNPIPFYQPVIEWFNDFLMEEKDSNGIVVNFDLEYFNTASSKQIARLLHLFENSPLNKKVTIRWHYSIMDTDILESGRRFNELTKLNFEFISNKCQAC